jgi:hypothetical protein
VDTVMANRYPENCLAKLNGEKPGISNMIMSFFEVAMTIRITEIT